MELKMNETTAKLLTYAVVVALAAILTKLTTDKKGWRITLLIVLVAGATYAEKVVDILFEKHGPHLIVIDTPIKYKDENGKIKLYSSIAVNNDGDKPAEEVNQETTYYVDGKVIGKHKGDRKIDIDVGETVSLPIYIEVGKDVWEGSSKLVLYFVAKYKYGDEALPPLRKKWVFNPNRDNELIPMWEIVQVDEK